MVSKRALGLAAAVATALAAPAAIAADTIKIGEINHYKRMAAFAEPYKKGIELGLAEINGAGGVRGTGARLTPHMCTLRTTA